MLRSVLPRAILAAVLTTASAVYANAQQLRATLLGFNEAPLTLVSTGRGTLTVNLNRQQKSLSYQLTYSDLEGDVTQAHIHIGTSHQTGAISVWLCQTANTPSPAEIAGSTPFCPQSGTVSGLLTPASVIGPAEQGVPAGAFDKLAEALLSNATYGNVHSTKYPGGEIRGQLSQTQNQNEQ